MDWSTNLVARASKEPPSNGGWNVIHTWFQADDVISPAVHFGVSGAGPGAWFGWPKIPQLETLITEWLRASNQTKRKEIADLIQKSLLARWRTYRGESRHGRRPSEAMFKASSSSGCQFSGTWWWSHR